MKNIFHWLTSKFPARKSYDEILKLIYDHELETERASKVLDKAIAALDGETGWWSCRCDPIEKECKNAHNNHSNT
jgi:hypothetical protein